jgi:hypothetical protein
MYCSEEPSKLPPASHSCCEAIEVSLEDLAAESGEGNCFYFSARNYVKMGNKLCVGALCIASLVFALGLNAVSVLWKSSSCFQTQYLNSHIALTILRRNNLEENSEITIFFTEIRVNLHSFQILHQFHVLLQE